MFNKNIFLDEEVYFFGNNDFSQLGISNDIEKIKNPTKINLSIKKISLGGKHNLVMQNGFFYFIKLKILKI
jgi:alpha-tubulin suppressor-like RCC1 family protein